MYLTLRDIIEKLPLKFSQGNSDILKRLMLKDDNEFLRFKGKEQFDKKVKALYPDIDIFDLSDDYLFAQRKAYAVRRLCQWYEDHGGERVLLKFRYEKSMDDSGAIIGTEFKVLDGVVCRITDYFWNKYLPPNSPHDNCSVDTTFDFIDKTTPIPDALPESNFECDYNSLFLSNITPKKHELQKQSFEDTKKMFFSFGIDIQELIIQNFLESEKFKDLSKYEMRKYMEDYFSKKSQED